MTKKEAMTSKLKREFILAIVHDLKNPVIALEKMIEMLLEQPDKTPIGNFKSMIQEGASSNKKMLKMLDDILAIYHWQITKFELTLEKADLKKMLQEIVSELKYLTLDKNIKISLNIDEKIPEINAGKDEIYRVFTNLIMNAIRYSFNDSEIKINLELKDNKIIFSVLNHGEKLSNKAKKALFNPYKTAKNKLGHGLGLYISKKIIELHNGEIWVETSNGNEITFHFAIPTI